MTRSERPRWCAEYVLAAYIAAGCSSFAETSQTRETRKQQVTAIRVALLLFVAAPLSRGEPAVKRAATTKHGDRAPWLQNLSATTPTCCLPKIAGAVENGSRRN